MADVFYTLAETDWTISSLSVDTEDKYNLYDNNFDTQYEFTGADAGAKALWIDRGDVATSGSYKPITHLGIVFHSGSYVDWSGTPGIHGFQNVVASGTGSVGTINASFEDYLNDGTSIFLAPVKDWNLRYIYLQVANMPVDPVATQILLLRQHTTSRTHSIKNSSQVPKWHTSTSSLHGPVTRAYSTLREPIQSFKNHYPLYGNADIQQGIDIFNDCRGRQLPFLYTDGLNSGVTRICRFTTDTAEIKDIEQDHKEQVFKFDEIYKIRSGYTT